MGANPLSTQAAGRVSLNLPRNATNQPGFSDWDSVRAFGHRARAPRVLRTEEARRYKRYPASLSKSARLSARRFPPPGTRLDVRPLAAVVPASCPQFRLPHLAPERKECSAASPDEVPQLSPIFPKIRRPLTRADLPRCVAPKVRRSIRACSG